MPLRNYSLTHTLWGFLNFSPNGWEFVSKIYTHLLYVRIYAKLQNFVHSSPTLDKFTPYQAWSSSEFSLLTTHLAWILLCDNKQRLKTEFITIHETANRDHSNYLCVKFISRVENVHHQLKHMHSDVCVKSLTALSITVCGQSSQIYCSALFSSGMALSFGWYLWNAWRIASHTCKSSRLRHDEFGGPYVATIAFAPSCWCNICIRTPVASVRLTCLYTCSVSEAHLSVHL